MHITDEACRLLHQWERKANGVTGWYGSASMESVTAWRTLAQALRYLLTADHVWVDEGMVMGMLPGGMTFGVLVRERSHPKFPAAPASFEVEVHS